ncbi:MAG: ATP-dependent Clp protease ATP-binding subunit ClpX, partial [Phycisphaeraceae bacterium]|nr:ATP-dependent Clp protease ATP-binding subunit ClpX [Phycisphaeraceae bacterium]
MKFMTSGRTGKGNSDKKLGESGFQGRRVTTCSFCGKTSREVGPMVEGPNDVYICANCVDLCQNIFKQEQRRVTTGRTSFDSIPTPRQITEFLNEYVVGQTSAKRALSVA